MQATRSQSRFAFVTFRGSWDRYPASGYKVMRVAFDELGKPTEAPAESVQEQGDLRRPRGGADARHPVGANVLYGNGGAK